MFTNKRLGNRFEAEFCDTLFNHGFWVHNMVQNASGQPADVIAVKGKRAYLIDCKVCTNDSFPLSRIEDNQHYAMTAWRDCKNGEGWFALKVGNEVFMIAYSVLTALSHDVSVLDKSMIRLYGHRLDKWLAWL